MSIRPCILASILLLPGFPAAAQAGGGAGQSGTTVIYGTVPSVCTVEVDSGAAVLQLTTGFQGLTGVTYTCNSPNGFSRRIFSENGGALVRGEQRIPYQISQTGSADLAVPPVGLEAPFADDVAPATDVVMGGSGQLRAEIPSVPPALLAGEYTDTVTIEITPN